MNVLRLHADPRRFGRRQPFVGEAVAVRAPGISEDGKLFLTTFAAGFLFVTLFLA